MKHKPPSYQVIELQGIRYAVIQESQLKAILRKAGFSPTSKPDQTAAMAMPEAIEPWDPQAIAGHLIQRRDQAGLTQADLARRAGVRVETLNRIERGKTTPDFSTIRKLAIALKHVERRVSV